MNSLVYKSKGISKKAVKKMVISIIIDCVIAVMLIFLANSKVDGPKQSSSIGGAGSAHYVSLEQDRFDDKTQAVLASVGLVFFVSAFVEVVMIAMYKVSWTEIYTDKIQAKYINKIISYSVAGITSVTETSNKVKVKGSAGNISVIVENPKEASQLLQSIIRN